MHPGSDKLAVVEVWTLVRCVCWLLIMRGQSGMQVLPGARSHSWVMTEAAVAGRGEISRLFFHAGSLGRWTACASGSSAWNSENNRQLPPGGPVDGRRGGQQQVGFKRGTVTCRAGKMNLAASPDSAATRAVSFDVLIMVAMVASWKPTGGVADSGPAYRFGPPAGLPHWQHQPPCSGPMHLAHAFARRPGPSRPGQLPGSKTVRRREKCVAVRYKRGLEKEEVMMGST